MGLSRARRHMTDGARVQRPRVGRHVLGGVLAGVLVAAFSLTAQAVPSSFTTSTLNYSSPNQSFFGAGGAAAFNFNQLVLGDSGTGIRVAADASTGAVNSAVSGRLQASFDDRVQLSAAGSYAFNLDWLGGSSIFNSNLGAGIRVSGNLLGIITNFTIADLDYSLNISENFTSETPVTKTGNDEFSPASVSVGLPTGGVGLSGTAGVDLDIDQTATFRVLRATGTVVATHLGSGTTRNAAFNLDVTSPETISGLDLSLPGFLDFDFTQVRLFGTFSSAFDLEIDPFIGGGIGVFCGDPFDPNDNILCATEGGAKTDALLSFDLFNTPLININYAQALNREGFRVRVVEARVSEPATLALIALGVLALAGAATALGYRQRRRQTALSAA